MSVKNKHKTTKAHGLSIIDDIDLAVHAIVSNMSPLKIGRMLHPTGIVVALCDVPEQVFTDHASR